MNILDYYLSFIKVLSNPTNRNRKISTIFTLVWWKLNQLFLGIPAVVEIVPGVFCICYPQSSYGSLVVYTRFPEYDEMNFLYSICKSESICIDVGANIGVYSLLFASKVDSGKIYSFEPSRKVLPIFLQNINLNNLSEKIKVQTQIVSDHHGDEWFTDEDITEVSHISYDKIPTDINNKSKLSATTLDNFCKSQKIKHIDILKIDVEGAEYKVLQGFKKSLEQAIVDVILLEINTNMTKYNNSQDVISLLKNYHFKLYYFSHGKLKEITDSYNKKETVNIVALNPWIKKNKKLSAFFYSL